MKKAITVIAVIIVFAAAFAAGRSAGIHHAVTCSEIWLNEWTEAENGDWEIHIDLDGQDYIHELWVY